MGGGILNFQKVLGCHSFQTKIAFNLPVCVFSITLFPLSLCPVLKKFTMYFAMASISVLFPEPPRPRWFHLALLQSTAESIVRNAELCAHPLELLECFTRSSDGSPKKMCEYAFSTVCACVFFRGNF